VTSTFKKLKPNGEKGKKRKNLFKRFHPLVRELKPFDGEGYSNDLKIMWIAHQAKPFNGLAKDISQEDFAKAIVDLTSDRIVHILDDVNLEFVDHGPVGFISSLYMNDWVFEPHAEFFAWATPRNVMSSLVSFLQYMRYQKVGVVTVRCLEDSVPLFNKLRDYLPLYGPAKIICGDPRGDEYVYSMRGRNNVGHVGSG